MGATRRVVRGVAASTPLVLSTLKIHPAIGIARVGNDLTQFFLGPEIPRQGPVGAADGVGTSVASGPFSGFKTATDKVKGQAQRFYLFSHTQTGDPVEINLDTPGVKAIEWGVHLANKKAAFFQFGGLLGQDATNVYSPATNRRNPGEDLKRLVIDPDKPQKISGRNQGPLQIDFKLKGPKANWPIHKFTGKVVIGFLGALHTDAKGRVVVRGGRGLTRPFEGTAKDLATGTPDITNFANNNKWLDDVSDGVVTAKITLNNGRTVQAQAAWVLVGPPDYAPGIHQVVTLYDLLWDVAAHNTSIPIPDLTMFKREPLKRLGTFRTNIAAYKPEFNTDIVPFYKAVEDQKFVAPGIAHFRLTAALASKSDSGVFAFLRPPAGNQIFDPSTPGSMPLLYGDDYLAPSVSNGFALAVTRSQFKNAELFKNGVFDEIALPAPIVTPEGLDRAALDSCVGGAFSPGIECGWMIRNPKLFAEPFRFKPVGTVLNAAIGLKIAPGFLSQQLAMPWQADFLSCTHDPPGSGSATPLFGWWPAQRPTTTNVGQWDRSLPAGQAGLVSPTTGWPTRGFVVPAAAGGFEEKGGPP